ncbi:NAD-dependent deacetylase sirtuin-5, partial [Termitomyces sp. T112]
MSTTSSDIVVFGATGFTGRLITRYLVSHPQFTQGSFSFAIAARSQSKLHALVQELKLPSSINIVQVDVTDFKSVEAAVQRARVVINTIGPYWRWGTPVVKACARNGVHYVDLTGESVWIKDIVNEFDYLATKTGAIIVPSCGYDSVPSDVSAYLSNKTLKAHGDYDVATSISGQIVRGGISGGTLNTIFTILEDVPQDKLRESARDYSLSPVRGEVFPAFRLLYEQVIPGETSVPGSFFLMAPGNTKLVQRTFGLLELQTITATQSGSSAEATKIARRERYGSSFAYEEFLIMSSRFSAIAFSTMFMTGFLLLARLSPLRWLLKKFVPAPGSGPSEESMEKGFFEIINHTTSTSTPPVHVKTVFKGDRDPGYALTA